jgi:DNA-binding NarL/FixJ family response regulator
MDILIHIRNRLVAEALKHLLTTSGYEHVMIYSQGMTDSVSPDIILADSLTIEEFQTHCRAKVILMDTGVEKDKLIMLLLSHRVHGLLSRQTEVHTLRQVFKTVEQGQFWTDDTTIKAFLLDSGLISKSGKINGVTQREKEIIDLVVQGHANKEIADQLSLTEDTVKAHLSNIFRKFDTTSRSKLISFVVSNASKQILSATTSR